MGHDGCNALLLRFGAQTDVHIHVVVVEATSEIWGNIERMIHQRLVTYRVRGRGGFLSSSRTISRTGPMTDSVRFIGNSTDGFEIRLRSLSENTRKLNHH